MSDIYKCENCGCEMVDIEINGEGFSECWLMIEAQKRIDELEAENAALKAKLLAVEGLPVKRVLAENE